MTDQEWDGTTYPTCPHCDHRHRDCVEWHDWQDGEQLDHDCDACGKPFVCTVSI